MSQNILTFGLLFELDAMEGAGETGGESWSIVKSISEILEELEDFVEYTTFSF